MPEIEFGNSAVGDASTFRESIAVETMPNGTTWSGAEIGVKPGSDREAEVQRLVEENVALRDRVAELERTLEAARS